MFRKLIQHVENWIANIVRKELAEFAAVFGKDFEELTKKITADRDALETHITKEVQKSYRKACALCGQMVWKYESFDTFGRARCMDCSVKGRIR